MEGNRVDAFLEAHEKRTETMVEMDSNAVECLKAVRVWNQAGYISKEQFRRYYRLYMLANSAAKWEMGVSRQVLKDLVDGHVRLGVIREIVRMLTVAEINDSMHRKVFKGYNKMLADIRDEN